MKLNTYGVIMVIKRDSKAQLGGSSESFDVMVIFGGIGIVVSVSFVSSEL